MRREGSEKLTFDIWVGFLLRLSQGEEKKKRSLQQLEMHLTDFSGPRKEKRYCSLLGVERGGGPSFHATFNSKKYLYYFSWEKAPGKITRIAVKIPKALMKIKFLKL